MNALTTISEQDEGRLIDVMRASLYPGARSESVSMVLSYCRARGLDPLRKPVHIVPIWVTPAGTKQGGMQDVVMPGIALYRIEAARTGEYAGKSEPEFGPIVKLDLEGGVVSVPEWCRVTVYRMVGGQRCEFTAKEYWIENYATAGRNTDQPNAMWRKRAFGQLAKCAEAQALRMAFPEATGGEPTAEEMEGKGLAPRDVPNLAPQPAPAPRVVDDAPEFPFLTMAGKEVLLSADKWRASLAKALAALHDADTLAEWRAERGGLLARIYEAGAEELVADAERAIDMRAAELAEARA